MSPIDHNLPIPSIEGSKTLYNEYIKIRRDTLRYQNGHTHNYYTMETHSEAISIIATTPEGLFLLNKEYRHSCGKVLLCCPGGFLDNNEPPVEGARRELLEETGYTADQFQLIGNAHPLPGLCSQNVSYVLASGVNKVTEPNLEPSEILHPLLMTQSEINQYIANGHAVDGILCSALLLYQVYHSKKS